MFLLLSAKSVAGLHNIIGVRRARAVGDLVHPEREGHRRERADIGQQQLETHAHRRESTLRASRWSDACRAAGSRRIIEVTARELRPRADDYVVRGTRVGPENAGHGVLSQHNLTRNIMTEATLGLQTDGERCGELARCQRRSTSAPPLERAATRHDPGSLVEIAQRISQLDESVALPQRIENQKSRRSARLTAPQASFLNSCRKPARENWHNT